MLSNQEIFNKVYTHLLTQNAKSESCTFCMYRTPRGLSCAVGCLIPDEVYSPSIEGASIYRARLDKTSPQGRVADLLKALEGSGIDFELSAGLLSELQGIHDNLLPSGWGRALRLLAKEFGLTLPEMPSRTE